MKVSPLLYFIHKLTSCTIHRYNQNHFSNNKDKNMRLEIQGKLKYPQNIPISRLTKAIKWGFAIIIIIKWVCVCAWQDRYTYKNTQNIVEEKENWYWRRFPLYSLRLPILLLHWHTIVVLFVVTSSIFCWFSCYK